MREALLTRAEALAAARVAEEPEPVAEGRLQEFDPVLYYAGLGISGWGLGAVIDDNRKRKAKYRRRVIGALVRHRKYGVGHVKNVERSGDLRVGFHDSDRLVRPEELELHEAQYSHLDSADNAYHTVVCRGCGKSSGLEKPTQTPGGANHFRCKFCGTSTRIVNQPGEDVREGPSKKHNNRENKAVRHRRSGVFVREAIALAEDRFEESLRPSKPKDLLHRTRVRHQLGKLDWGELHRTASLHRDPMMRHEAWRELNIRQRAQKLFREGEMQEGSLEALQAAVERLQRV